ncbi:MAG TPA: DUF2197 domain-containing protein [Bacillus sp. (in: firmicutes)]|uniref:DUF2197 domain-containing protein n=1 Tax=Bacillus litorisediminis TaxID=2922713 RepID=UPI001FAB42EC|nr:DUF2197 domain-containing protein [Bacillus litorisediminis]HWO74637.1 DUF2197 domain-containing protein [Bacillus sp. (in: firmicutes)]
MFYYEVHCYSCKKVYRVYEGTKEYKHYKKKREKGIYCCEDCSHNIRIEAIKNFFR